MNEGPMDHVNFILSFWLPAIPKYLSHIDDIILCWKCWTRVNGRRFSNLSGLFLGKFFHGCVGSHALSDIDEVVP